jgi:hypothetical protein
MKSRLKIWLPPVVVAPGDPVPVGVVLCAKRVRNIMTPEEKGPTLAGQDAAK